MKRDEIWAGLESAPWDMIVVGGGITGAGILDQAARLGLRALLVEARDFAWGTSSRSSKMVHGGLRYLKDGNFHLTYESVRERQALLDSAPGLVEDLGFLIANFKGDRPGKTAFGAALAIYDLMAFNWTHRYYTADDFRLLAPHVTQAGLKGGFRYTDAQTDDARLVLRVLQEAADHGGQAINYAPAEAVIREGGRVVGVEVRDVLGNRRAAPRAQVVINATGAWADQLRGQVGEARQIRPLRGSHLVFPAWRLPVAQAISFLHPTDRRPVFAFPWEGVTVVGTTDVDHPYPLDVEPAISPDEAGYLMAAIAAHFPELPVTLDDVISTWAGVRPVIDTGKTDPSKESREHAIWDDNGLITVTGGKLTTFRVMALDVLEAARAYLPDMAQPDRAAPPLELVESALDVALPAMTVRRLVGRYGRRAADLVGLAGPDELTPIPDTHTLWAELRYAARYEVVAHLEDLMLRRTRIGMLLAQGGTALMPRIRQICQAELGWDDVRWETEQNAYAILWRSSYSLPARDAIPDWRAMAAEAKAVTQKRKRSAQRGRVVAAAGLTALGIILRRRRARKQRGGAKD